MLLNAFILIRKNGMMDFLRELSELIQRYREAIHLHHIGFIDNWKEVLKK